MTRIEDVRSSRSVPQAAAPRPGIYRRVLPALAAAALAAHLYGLYAVGGPPEPVLFPGVDKVHHVVAFAVPVTLLLLSKQPAVASDGRRGTPAPGRWTVGVVAVFGAHAVVSEIVQHTFYTWRNGDPLDTLADLAGTWLGWVSYRLLRRPRDQAPAGGRLPGRS